MEARELAIECARIADGLRAEEVHILDVHGLSSVTDYFVICSGDSRQQLRAITNKIREFGKQHRIPIAGVEGYEAAHWILMDYYDVVVHIFDRELRAYYDLELLWGDAPKVE